jgi:drug/metabolite transporter (DMT)-like permease
MSYAALSLVVLAAFIHAAWNLLSKRAALAGPSFVFAYNLFCCVLYAPWALWILARGEMAWNLPVVGCILLTGVVHLAYSLCLQRGYQVADLSVVYPVARGMGPTVSTLAAFLFLGEAPTSNGILGLLCVVVGIGLISTQGNLAIFRRPGGLTGVRWGVVTGMLIACYTVVDAYGVKVLAIHPVVLDWCSNFLRFAFLAPLMLHDSHGALKRMRGKWRLAVGVGLLSPLSYILVLMALSMQAPLSIVAPMREMSMMVGALFGMVILQEPVGRWRIVGCFILIVGVILLGAE